MQDTLKDSIMGAVKAYMATNGMNGADFARRAGVNKSYFNVAYNGKYTFQSTTIPDSFFHKVAQAAAYSIRLTYFPHRDTPQYIDATNALYEARDKVEPHMIIGETGCGKTYAVDRFCEQNPVGVFRVTVNDYDTIRDILEEIAKSIGLQTTARRGALLRQVCRALKELAASGLKVILIIDEAENTKVPGLKAYKALYDLLKGFASLVLAGTPDLLKKLEMLKRKGVEGMPQFIRRFKAKTTLLESVNRSFPDFNGIVSDAGVWRLATSMCDNYGELHDYLEPAIREAQENNEELNEAFFRELYNLPKAI